MTIEFQLSAEQRDLQALAHDFAERELRPIAPREEFPPELLATAPETPRIRITSPAQQKLDAALCIM